MTDLKKIKAFVFDVDGVLTDGGVLAVEGDLLRRFDAKDCFGFRMATMHGYILGIITGGISKTIPQRLHRCGFAAEDVYLGSRDKVEQLMDFCGRHGIDPAEVVYCGDDLPDIPAMKACGIGACPADAMPQVIAQADYVSEYDGGHRFARYIVEMVMRAQGTWNLDVEVYKDRF